ncbi:MAG: cysteine desulfurase NifS [Eubacteriaceae bacterium]|nr:cysteine desulfurase NifS [Eubacteriaceae bacterium]
MIYLDNAATTMAMPEVLEAMAPYFTQAYANPSSVYSFAADNKKAIDDARHIIAESLNAADNEIFFTAGGTESDNWALIGAFEANSQKGSHIITTRIEHHAVLHTCEYLESRGAEITYLDVDEFGIIDINQLEAAIRPDTILVTVMYANNEIGTLQPIKEIGQITKKHGVIFHTDAVQAYAHLPIDVDDLNIDLLSASAHKLYGPKGIGFLYVRKRTKIANFVHGGAQEKGKRAGTENVPGIVGFGEAVRLAIPTREERAAKEVELRDYLIDSVLSRIEYSRLNGHKSQRLPNNANFSFQFIEGESMLLMLDIAGVCASSGSACTSGSLDPSHVLLAIGLAHETAHGSLRLTLNHTTTKEELDYVVGKLEEIIIKLRAMSPLYEDHLKRQKN